MVFRPIQTVCYWVGTDRTGEDPRGVTDGLKTTFRLLGRTENEAATRALIPALDSPYPGIREAALEAILSRRSPAGHREVLRRLESIDPRAKRIVADHPGHMTPTLREAVLGADLLLCTNACRAALWLREYELIPALITALEDPLNPNSDLAGRTLTELTHLLCEDLAAPQDRRGRRDPQVVRGHVVTSLELSVKRYAKHRRREILEAFVLLADRNNSTLQQILQDPHHSAFLAVVDALSHSAEGSVIWLLLSFLDEPHAPSAALSVVFNRSDLKFIQGLLRKIGREPSPVVTQNLKRVESIAWLRGRDGMLDQLDDPGQHAVVRLLMASGVPRAQAFGTIRSLLLHGKVGGRRAAAEALDAFQGAEANDLALQALQDEDPQVQANVLPQLRGRGIPGALARLVELVDSPHAIVRKAARKCLTEFTFRRFLAAFDMLDDEVRLSTGALVKKVDLQTIPLLKAEMESKVCKRRRRALAIATAIDAVAELEPAIVQLLHDEDHLVRADAASTLRRSTSPTARQALSEATADRSPLVQEAARQSLHGPNQFDQARERLFDPRD